MNSSGKSFFDQFLSDYFAECEEHLTSARQTLLSLESSGLDKSIDANALDELLRNFHSIKGLSAMVGLEEATQLAHHVEDYLKELKRPGIMLSAEGVERVVVGITAIEQVLECKRRSERLPDVSLAVVQLDDAADQLRSLSHSGTPGGTEASIWRFSFRSSPELAKKGITVNSVRDRLRKIGDLIKASPQVSEKGGVTFEFIVVTAAPETTLENFRMDGIEFSRVSQDAAVSAPAAHDVTHDLAASKTGPLDFVRVEMNRLDDLMRLVGDLVISRFRLDELARANENATGDWRALHDINTAMERQLREIREGVVSMRMVPVGQIFERMRFVVRGLERELNKNVKVHIEGQDTEIDKVVVERMMAPLLHLVRNAISHGLESPEERVASGKSETGLLRLAATTSGDIVVIEVEDDGRGIDINKILKRAHALGWTATDESIDSKRMLDIIAAPGFTTRDHADLASGRGVGMTAVRTVVSELGGSMTLTTAEGRGTRFTIRLPVTLMIADSLMVTVNQQRFAVPQTAVREVFAIEASAVNVLENNEVVPFRGGVLPIVRLARVFHLETRNMPDARLHVLVISDGASPTGLAVDRINGQRAIVVRTMTDPLLRVPGVVGATELGDGRPILILDPNSVVRAAREPLGSVS